MSEHPVSETARSMKIEGELTIYRAAELREVLKGALSAAPARCEFEIDLSDVSEMDSAGVQLLLAARRTARATGRELRIVAPSRAVVEVLGILRLSAQLDDMPLSAASTH
jgi:anti-sigma B factor antagonist